IQHAQPRSGQLVPSLRLGASALQKMLVHRETAQAPARSTAPTIPHQGVPPGVRPAPRRIGRVRRWLRVLGPGVISVASNRHPSAIGTYAQAGAAFGFATLWVALAALPMMATAQYMAAKIGMVSGRGLAGVLRHHYPRWLLYPVVVALV